MRDIVYESACVALKMLRCLGAESANPADLNFAQFAVGPAGRAFRPAVESLVKAAAKALCVAQRAKVSEQSNLETTKHKAQMLLTLGTAFFAVIAELCASFNLKVDGTLNDRDLVMLRSCIDAALGMLYELKSATWRVGQPVPQEVLDEMAEHVDSNMLKCAGYRAVSAIEQVYAAVLCEASLH